MHDKEIIQMYWDRNEEAIAATSEKYGSYCQAIAMNILGNWEDARECVNDTYLNTWNSIPPQRPQMLSAYLGKIVRNLSFNLYKKNRAEKRGGGQMPLILDEISEMISDFHVPEKEWHKRELIQAINAFLSGLTRKKREIFVRRYWYADSVKEIAERFEMSENNVSVTLNRLRKQLHRYLKERGFEL